MKETLKPGADAEFEFAIPPSKTVPELYPESEAFQAMPAVFATGFMVGLMEWATLKVLQDHLDDGEGSLGTHIDVSHVSPTVPGQVVKVSATCVDVQGRKVAFDVEAHDGVDMIGKGRIKRMIVPWKRFEAMVNMKAGAAGLTADLWRKG